MIESCSSRRGGRFSSGGQGVARKQTRICDASVFDVKSYWLFFQYVLNGGDNSYNNLIPLPKDFHDDEVTPGGEITVSMYHKAMIINLR